MKLSRRLIALLLSVVMILSLAGCNLDAGIANNGSSNQTVSSQIQNSGASLGSTDDASSSSRSTDDLPSSETDRPSKANVGNGTATAIDPSQLPAYSGSPYTVVNGNQPNFSASELTTVAYEKYSSLDSLGRCGVALASCGKEIMPEPNEERGSISSIKPTGWIQAKYSGISGGYLWNRCHLIGWQLSAENANKQNLVTGTRYMNVDGMLPFENMVADYIRETGNHVAYRVTPIFEGNNLVCSGVQMEAYSIEDDGEGICFNVNCYNIQPGITINYSTGASSGPGKESTGTSGSSGGSETKDEPSSGVVVMVWIPRTGSKYHRNSSCSNMNNPSQVTLDEAIRRGFEPCKKCY